MASSISFNNKRKALSILARDTRFGKGNALISGLLENSLRPFPVALKNELFDDCDRPIETKLTTGKDLQKIEKVAR